MGKQTLILLWGMVCLLVHVCLFCLLLRCICNRVYHMILLFASSLLLSSSPKHTRTHTHTTTQGPSTVMATEEQPKDDHDDDVADASGPIKLGDTFSYPDGENFTILLPFRSFSDLIPFSGRWDASLGGLREQRGMALDHLAIQ